MTKHKNEIPSPFKEGDGNNCIEILRVWATEDNTIKYSARFDFPGPCKDDIALFGVALSELAYQFASEAAKNHGLDREAMFNEIAKELRGLIHA
jgi:Domain of unknown function (DUF5076)